MSLNDVRILEIDMDVFKNNIEKIKQYCGEKVIIMPILKANAYGTHVNQNIEMIKDFKIVGVANAKEGEDLRKIGFKNDIFVLNQPYESDLEMISKNNLSIGISSKEFIEKANNDHKPIKVHLEIDTGMGRTGIFYSQIEDFIKRLGDSIKVEGIYTHFSAADSDIEYTKKQLDLFNKAIIKVEKLLGNIQYKHAAASNGIINFKDSHFNMVRPGVMAYGYQSFDGLYEKIGVKPIAKLKCRITYIKEVGPGTSISYSRKFITDKKMRIATIPIGYADGVNRKLSNIGNVVINGRKARIIGTVCMDSIMVDISEIEQVQVGDYAYIWDNEKITLEEVAEQCDTINYEILCNISDRVERKFINCGDK